jgi:hypothetical protein
MHIPTCWASSWGHTTLLPCVLVWYDKGSGSRPWEKSSVLTTRLRWTLTDWGPVSLLQLWKMLVILGVLLATKIHLPTVKHCCSGLSTLSGTVNNLLCAGNPLLTLVKPSTGLKPSSKWVSVMGAGVNALGALYQTPAHQRHRAIMIASS